MQNSFPVTKPGSSIKAILFLFVLTITIYSNSLGGEFVYDDEYFVVKNIHVHNLANIPSFFANPQASAFAELAEDLYRPLTTISYAIDYRLWRLNTFGYHLENVLLHALNAILLFILLRLIFGDIFIALVAALLFAVHPVQTEVVAWISGRSSVLFLFFYLSSFIAYIFFMKKRRRVYLISSLALFLGSLFSKEMAISLPLVLILYDIHFARGESFKKRVIRIGPYFLLAAFFVAVRFMVINRMGQCGWWGESPYYTFLTMLVVLRDYIRLLMLPVNLSAYYVTPIQTSITEGNVMFSASAIIALIASLPFIFARSRAASFAICLFFVTLLPVSNIVPLKALMAERFLYLPSIGFCIIIAVILGAIAGRDRPAANFGRRILAILITAALVISYSARTIERNEDWKSQVAVSSAIIKVDPLNPWGLTTLGAAYSSRGQYEMAVKPLAKALALTRGYFAPMNVLGFCYLELGRYDDAIRILSDALKIQPDNLEGLSSIGVAYAQMKKYDMAIQQFEHAIRIDPSFVDAYMNLATVYDQMGQSEKALQIYQLSADKTRSIQSKAVIYVRMGDVYARLNNSAMAKESYGKAIGLCGSGMEEFKKIVTDRLSRTFPY